MILVCGRSQSRLGKSVRRRLGLALSQEELTDQLISIGRTLAAWEEAKQRRQLINIGKIAQALGQPKRVTFQDTLISQRGWPLDVLYTAISVPYVLGLTLIV